MSNPLFGDYPEPAELAEPQGDEELVVDLLGEYLERRNGETSGLVLLAELEARATAHGSRVREGLLEAVAYYEIRRLIWPDDVAGPQPEGRVRDGLARDTTEQQD